MIGAPRAAPPLPSWRAERILFEEAGLLVVDKPIGMPVHGGDESLRHSVVERLADDRAARGLGTYLGVHSRLDQGTSGALLFVTDESRNAEVARAFESHAIRRTYVALVRLGPGARLAPNGRIELSLSFERGRARVVARGGDRAVTHYRILERVGDRALLELELETGRTHQIRVSLAHLGAPVVGDAEYGGDPAWRIFLHATSLEGAPLPRRIESALPREFRARLDGASEDVDVEDRLLDAIVRRAPLVGKTGALRLANGEGDGLPGLVVDGYATHAVVNVYDEKYLDRLDATRRALERVGYVGAYLKKRVRADLRAEEAARLAPEAPFFGEAALPEFLVEEEGRRVVVSLSDGLSTGLFLDQRDNRSRLARGIEGRAGRRVLNLFAYTGSFSVAAARAGAHTVSVDLSRRAVERARENFRQNELDVSNHLFFKEDALEFLRRARKRGDVFHEIVLDPPSFATVGKGTFQVKGKYRDAAVDCFRLLSAGGRLWAITNHQKTTARAFRTMLEEAAALAGRSIEKLVVPPSQLDCPGDSFGSWPSKSVVVTVR